MKMLMRRPTFTSNSNRRKPSLSRRNQAKLNLCQLETRAVPAHFTVTLNTDSGSTTVGVSDGLDKGDLRHCIYLANNNNEVDTIFFDIGMDTIELSSTLGELVISKAVTIQGTNLQVGSFTVDVVVSGKGETRVFHVDAAGSDVQFLTLGITRGFADADGGGGIWVEAGDVTLGDYCDIWECTVEVNGGAIRTDDMMTISNTLIRNNTAGADGGGIWVSAGLLKLSDKIDITDNTAGGSGGGIAAHSEGENPSSIEMDLDFTSQIKSNQAGVNGGGISNDGGYLSCTSVGISSNVAGMLGGGIYSNGGYTEIASTTVKANTATAGSGGGTYLLNVLGFTLVGGSIEDCVAADKGGGIAIAGNDEEDKEVEISDTDIKTNTAAAGGGLDVTESNSSVEIYFSDIGSNTATGTGSINFGGGGVRLSSTEGSVLAYHCTINYNIAAKVGAGVFGSVVADFTLDSSSVGYNTASTSGGGLSLTGTPGSPVSISWLS